MYIRLNTSIIIVLIYSTFSGVAGFSPCPKSWVAYGNMCYWASHTAVPWNSVADVCRLAHAYSKPAAVHDLLANSILYELLNGTEAWIGLSRNSSTGNFTWADGSAVDYTFWSAHQPGEGANCVVTGANSVTGQWGTAHCQRSLPFTCQLRACPDGWSQADGRCYLYRDHWVSADMLPILCIDIHPDAWSASIHSSRANQLLYSLKPENVTAWIGLDSSRGAYYLWTDGSEKDFLHWGADQPDDRYSYAYMAESGYWETSAYTAWRPFFCQIQL